eukprot:1235478-Pyramimonas_sp.AAC.1
MLGLGGGQNYLRPPSHDVCTMCGGWASSDSDVGAWRGPELPAPLLARCVGGGHHLAGAAAGHHGRVEPPRVHRSGGARAPPAPTTGQARHPQEQQQVRPV